MAKFYVAICKNKFYLYGDKREPVYIDGESFFEYETGKIREATDRLTNKIVDENNLSDANELNFFVIENSDAALNDSFAKAQGSRIVKRFPIDELLRKIISELAQNPAFYIAQFGINYDGECYNSERGLLTKTEYSLLALSIEPSALLKFVD